MGAPIGVVTLSKIFRFEYRNRRRALNQAMVLAITFLVYVALHAARKSFPSVKNRLRGEFSPSNLTYVNGFAPFDTEKGPLFFGMIDSLWSFSYSSGMFVTGHLAEQTSPKGVLSAGLLVAGLTTCAFGMAEFLRIHHIGYFIGLTLLNGVAQSTGWPSILAICSAWIPRKNRGLIFGLWINNYAVGNIVGQAISGIFVENNWGLAFICNGILCLVTFLIVAFFLAPNPKSMGFPVVSADKLPCLVESGEDSNVMKEEESKNVDNKAPVIGFFDALKIPAVLEYSFALFFTKFVIYTFLFWLPYYINAVGIQNYDVTASSAAFLALLFDIGGIIGNILAGMLLDLTDTPGILCCCLQVMSGVLLYIYSVYGSTSLTCAIVLLLICGGLVNGPHSLITGSISASLSADVMEKTGKQSTSTVTAIIDGIGCMGAAVAPIVVSKISAYGWNYVIYTLIVSSAMGSLLLTRLFMHDLAKKKAEKLSNKAST